MFSVVVKAFISVLAVVLCYEAYFFYSDGTPSHPFSGVHKFSSTPSLLHPHGGNKCLPSLDPSLATESKALRKACKESFLSPLPSSKTRVGTVTAHFGHPQKHYQKALKTHLLHSMIHGSSLEVMCTPVIDDLWNKPVFILSLLLDEMMKPPQERLEWMFWVDRDTLILDQCRPLSSFLPTKDTFIQDDHSTSDTDIVQRDEEPELADDGINLLVTNDWNGLNNGVFFVRVNQWAIELFSDIVAFRHYKPNVSLTFTEQSAMEIVMNEPRFQRNIQIVPQEWFNAYPKDTPVDFEEKEDETGLKEYHARRGDFLLHFAGRSGKDRLINEWVEMLERRKGPWQPEQIQRSLTASINAFWSKLAFYPP